MVHFPSPYEKKLPHEIQVDKLSMLDRSDTNYNRVIGSLVGLAIGDALGAHVEFRPRQYLVANPVQKMQGGGTWGLEAGKWTDDTSMALCLASSLLSQNGFNPYDQMVRYKWWYKYGYLSSTGHCFDIGQATRQSLTEFSARQKVLKLHFRCRSEHEVDTLTYDSVQRIHQFSTDCGDAGSAGNGALMRLAPVPLFYFRRPQEAIRYSAHSAALTHANAKAIDACRYYAALIVGALQGMCKDELLDDAFYDKHKFWFGEEALHSDILEISRGTYKRGTRSSGYEQGIRGKGYVVSSLEAALWAFWADEGSFEKGALSAVNLGDDTDTTAAIYCQLAGAFYGYDRLPREWRDKLYAHDFIVSIGEAIYLKGTEIALGPLDEPRQHEPATPLMHQRSYEETLQDDNNDVNSKTNLIRSFSLETTRHDSTNSLISSSHSSRRGPTSTKSMDTARTALAYPFYKRK